MNKKNISKRLYLSTVAGDAAATAKEFQLGLELSEFCTASNMDSGFEEWDAIVRNEMAITDRFVFHAAFNELCPAAIDPLVLNVAKKRYRQSWLLAKSYGVKRLVVHSGYVPFVYFKNYFVERSIEFWREYLADKPKDMTLALENVLEDEPFMLIDIVKGVGDPRLKLCLDVGHANITKNCSMEEWVKASTPYLGHVHLHNNCGWPDSHAALGDGYMDIETILNIITDEAPDATVTLEIRDSCRSSVEWLLDKGFLLR